MTTLTDGVRLPAQSFHVQRSDLSLFHLSITLLWLLPPTPSATTVFLHRSKLVLELGLRSHGSLATRQLRKLRQYVRDKADLARMRAGSRGVIDELIVELLVNTGLRASELCNLNIGDLPARHGKDCIWVRDGKGKVSRTVDISDKLKKRLERFVKLYRKGARAKSALLVSERGDRIIYRSIYAKIKRIGEQAGIGKLHPHMLRHTYLTRLYNVEKDLRFVQDQAGHASPYNRYLCQDEQ